MDKWEKKYSIKTKNEKRITNMFPVGVLHDEKKWKIKGSFLQFPDPG